MKNIENYITWTRIDNNVNGNPRYVCHFLNFKPLNHEELFTYEQGLLIAKRLGGKNEEMDSDFFNSGLMFWLVWVS